MIDWLTLIVDIDHAPIYGGEVVSFDPKGNEEWATEKRLSVEGSYSTKVSVQTKERDLNGRGTKVWISGNPSKWFQGHNIFGSDDLRHLAPIFATSVLEKLLIVPTLQEQLNLQRGEYQLQRMDSTGSFKLSSRDEVRAWIREAAMVIGDRYQKVNAYGEQTLYIGQHSRRIATKIYCKGDEIERKDHGLSEELDDWGRCLLKMLADTLLRVEVTIRSKELKRRGLERGSAWAYDTSSKILEERIQAMNLPENTAVTITPALLEGLPGRLQMAYQAWLQGHDLKSMLPKKTYYRYRSELLKHGIDLNKPPRKLEKSNIVPLVRYIVAENRLEDMLPDLFSKLPELRNLYFDPSKDRIAL